MTDYAVASGAKDWDDGSSTNSTLLITFNNISVVEQEGYMNIDTSAIAGDDISAATFWWYNNAYSTVGKPAHLSRIYIMNTGASWVQIWSSAVVLTTGWKSHALTSGELAYIQKGGETRMRFTVDDPGVAKAITWNVRAYEYVTSPDFAGYLAITHAAPPAGSPKVSIAMPIIG